MAERLPRVTASGLLAALHRDGWYEVRRSGSHVQLRHPTKPGRATVPYRTGHIVRLETLKSILEQTGLMVDRLIELL